MSLFISKSTHQRLLLHLPPNLLNLTWNSRLVRTFVTSYKHNAHDIEYLMYLIKSKLYKLYILIKINRNLIMLHSFYNTSLYDHLFNECMRIFKAIKIRYVELQFNPCTRIIYNSNVRLNVCLPRDSRTQDGFKNAPKLYHALGNQLLWIKNFHINLSKLHFKK